MINVDGVTLGNYRCNFHGVDLNRVWQSEDSRRHPEVGFVKSELRKLMKKLEVELLIDMHGHSNKYLKTHAESIASSMPIPSENTI